MIRKLAYPFYPCDSLQLIFCSRINLLKSCAFFQIRISVFKSRLHFISSTVEHRKCKDHEKRDQILVSKLKFNFQFSHQIIILLIDPFFSMWVIFIKTSAIVNCFINLKSFKGIYFVEIRKLKFFQKTASF